MKRRKALVLTASFMGASIVGSELFLSGCSISNKKKAGFSIDDIILMDEIGETILPDSDRSPGAKAAKIGEFMKTIVADCYDQDETEIFEKGLIEISEGSIMRYKKNFIDLTGDERIQLLTDFDDLAKMNESSEPVHFFTMMKQLVIWGYFTSEPGGTKALRFNPIPGRYDGCIDYAKGDRAWV